MGTAFRALMPEGAGTRAPIGTVAGPGEALARLDGPPVLRVRKIVAGAKATRGAGLDIVYSFHRSPFGPVLLMGVRPGEPGEGLCGLAFAGEASARSRVLEDMKARWPAARFCARPDAWASLARRLFEPSAWQAEAPFPLVTIGTAFDHDVWSALGAIALGRTASYGQIATLAGAPRAVRAVGAAVGRNPVAFLVPCHRVVGSDGNLTGYRWGLDVKRALLAWEADLRAAEPARLS